jgi:hypothetical protein
MGGAPQIEEHRLSGERLIRVFSVIRKRLKPHYVAPVAVADRLYRAFLSIPI